jgi:hypothetical protein
MGRILKDISKFTILGNIMIDTKLFYAKCKKMDDGCIDWMGGKHVQGYGMTACLRTADRKPMMTVVHRIAMALKLGRGLVHDDFVLHTCNNNLCVNEDHLYLGDYSATRYQMFMNNNYVYKQREIKKQNRIYKYTDAEIQWARKHTNKEIAKRFKLKSSAAADFKLKALTGYKWLPKE